LAAHGRPGRAQSFGVRPGRRRDGETHGLAGRCSGEAVAQRRGFLEEQQLGPGFLTARVVTTDWPRRPSTNLFRCSDVAG
jgi:hypothetical protein